MFLKRIAKMKPQDYSTCDTLSMPKDKCESLGSISRFLPKEKADMHGNNTINHQKLRPANALMQLWYSFCQPLLFQITLTEQVQQLGLKIMFICLMVLFS